MAKYFPPEATAKIINFLQHSLPTFLPDSQSFLVGSHHIHLPSQAQGLEMQRTHNTLKKFIE